ncbi:unnamed protein product [Owenia fusiformis]|uniref:Sulfatase-modifying factor enzyme-like domain-containing protein n=1 Tax=Owenia fusiformis TaxID=6347 RepID=A0A8S4N4D1_OWEFU|nr:unnamed protein product [Owenia fusiformis]
MKTNVLTGKLTFVSQKPCDLSRCTKSEIRAYFENSYDLNESLFTSLKDDSVFYLCPDRLRLPLVFYFAHTAVVYVNKLKLAGLIKERVNFDFETLFETGVDEMAWDDTENYRMGGSYKWPSIAEVVDYRRRVRHIILDVINHTPLTLPVTMESPWWALFMGMEHERIHIETSSVLIRQMPVDKVTKPEEWQYGPITYGEGMHKNPLVHIDTQNITIGKPRDFGSFGWDNEYGTLTTKVSAFKVCKYMITNREFLAFVHAGGYKQEEYWSAEAWKWLQYRKAKHPTFWVCDQGCISGCGGIIAGYVHCKPAQAEQHNGVSGYCNGHMAVDGNGHQGSDEGGGHNHHGNHHHQGQQQNGDNHNVSNGAHTETNGSTAEYKYRTMFDEIDLPLDWPVDVNYHEAKAYCAWKGEGFRLPGEAEHQAMKGTLKSVTEGTESDIIYQDKIEANLNLQYGSSTPVNMYPSNELGLCDVSGNVWEWMEDHFNGLPGYQSSFLYDDFSSPCFDGRHNMILGGSWISTGDEASRFARFAFRRHFFQHAGFRMVKTEPLNAERVEVPIRLVDTEVYILGADVPDNPVLLDEESFKVDKVPSTCSQLHWEDYDILAKRFKEEYETNATYYTELAGLCRDVSALHSNNKRLLTIGCGVGKIAFEMAGDYQQMLAIDFVARFVETALNLQKTGQLAIEGATAQLKQLDYTNIIFKQLTWLPNEVDFFDFVLMNDVDRLMNPHAWFIRFGEILQKDGILVAVSSKFTVDKIEEMLRHCFTLLETKSLRNRADSKGYSLVSIWKHV